MCEDWAVSNVPTFDWPPLAMYRLKLSRATAKQIDAVQASMRRVVAKKAHITAAHTDVLFGGFMGCGWRKWQDEVNIERLKILMLAWEEPNTVFGKVMRGAMATMQAECPGPDLVCNGRFTGGANPKVCDTWLGQLW